MKKFLFSLFALCAFALTGAEITILADQFTELKGWATEGSLIRSDEKGATAEATIKVDAAGKYTLWVRTKNFGENWRRTAILVNGKEVGVFGDKFGIDQSAPGLGYAKKQVELPAGEVKVSLKSTGAKCRVAALIFSNDAKFQPEDLNILNNKQQAAAAKSKGGKAGKGNLADDPGHMPSDLAIEVPRRPRGPKNGPEVLMFGGGRPWMTNGLAIKICAAGANLYLVNGFYLGGLSGASIKQTPQQKDEPTPKNYVPFEFKQLARYKAVFFSALAEKNQAKLVADGRADLLREYVKNGGGLLLTVNTPKELADLCPVELGNLVDPEDHQIFATRPEVGNFAKLPEKWGTFDPFRMGKPKDGATVLSKIVEADGTEVGVFAAVWNYGKGKVVFLNNDYNRRQSVAQFFNWGYAKYLVCGLLEIAGNFTLDLDKTLPPPVEKIEPKTLDRAEVAITVPDMSLARTQATVTVNGNVATFSNGYKVTVKNSGIDITFPGQDAPYIVDKKFPAIGFPAATAKVDDISTSEATNVKSKTTSSRDTLKVSKITGGDSLVITLTGAKGSLINWEFVTGSANVAGRNFAGIGEKIKIESISGPLLNQVKLSSKIDVGNKRFRRLACYAGPRGYAEYDLTGKVSVDTNGWNFFGNGQPFGWVEGSKAVYVDFVDEPFPVNVQYIMSKGRKQLSSDIKLSFGRVKVPQETAILWHMTADSKFNTDNDYMAMYQFQRHNLRLKAGFPEIPAAPVATYSNVCTESDRLASLKAAKEFGFEVIMVPLCPTALEAYNNDSVLDKFKELKQLGFGAYPWHPCCHTPGDTPIVYQHPEWFIHDEKGKLAGYFGGHFRTADMNNPDFMKYYMKMIDGMIDAGAVTAWYDMGGAASGTFNFATPESKVGFWAQKDIYKHWYDRGGFIITEGMNPLVKDGYLFFLTDPKRCYNKPVVGREFPYLGANSSGSDWWCQDFFRTSMYDWFHDVIIDAWPTKFESHPGQLAELAKIKAYLPAVKEALSLGMPFIQQTPCGTSWISEKGAVLFCFDGVNDLKVELPEGFVAESITCSDGVKRDLGGATPQKVAPGSIIIFRKK